MTSRPDDQVLPADLAWLSRSQAAAWFAGRGLTHVTVPALAKLAWRGAGPRYKRLGKHAYYLPENLDAWLKAEMKEPVGCGPRPAA
jgi:hypothetical protein